MTSTFHNLEQAEKFARKHKLHFGQALFNKKYYVGTFNQLYSLGIKDIFRPLDNDNVAIKNTFVHNRKKSPHSNFY